MSSAYNRQMSSVLNRSVRLIDLDGENPKDVQVNNYVDNGGSRPQSAQSARPSTGSVLPDVRVPVTHQMTQEERQRIMVEHMEKIRKEELKKIEADREAAKAVRDAAKKAIEEEKSKVVDPEAIKKEFMEKMLTKDGAEYFVYDGNNKTNVILKSSRCCVKGCKNPSNRHQADIVTNVNGTVTNSNTYYVDPYCNVHFYRNLVNYRCFTKGCTRNRSSFKMYCDTCDKKETTNDDTKIVSNDTVFSTKVKDEEKIIKEINDGCIFKSVGETIINKITSFHCCVKDCTERSNTISVIIEIPTIDGFVRNVKEQKTDIVTHFCRGHFLNRISNMNCVSKYCKNKIDQLSVYCKASCSVQTSHSHKGKGSHKGRKGKGSNKGRKGNGSNNRSNVNVRAIIHNNPKQTM